MSPNIINNVTFRCYYVALIAKTGKQLRHSKVHTRIAEQLKDWLAVQLQQGRQYRSTDCLRQD